MSVRYCGEHHKPSRVMAASPDEHANLAASEHSPYPYHADDPRTRALVDKALEPVEVRRQINRGEAVRLVNCKYGGVDYSDLIAQVTQTRVWLNESVLYTVRLLADAGSLTPADPEHCLVVQPDELVPLDNP